jgi:hypothetical protein
MWWKYYVLVHKNGKKIPVERNGSKVGGGIKENDGGDEFNYDIL